MKKLLLVGLFLFPFASFAQTTTVSQSQILALIASLTQQVQLLQAQVAALSVKATTIPTFTGISTVATTSKPAYQIAITPPVLSAYQQTQQDNQIEIAENAACKPYTLSTPIKSGNMTIFPIIGSLCAKDSTGGSSCGC